MSEIGNVYGQALYDLASSEQLSEPILEQLQVLDESFADTPAFLKLLASPNLPKQERCQILDQSFRDKVHPYVLNFLKILTEEGYVRHFHACFAAYEEAYNTEHNILVVTARTAIPLSPAQSDKLRKKLEDLTGKQIRLKNKVDTALLGGVQLDMGNKRLDDTVAHRLDSIRDLLKQTTL